MSADIPMPHPGVVLREEFLEPMGLTVYALAKAIHVTRSRINDICHGRHGITAAIALRLGRFFSVDPQWFMNGLRQPVDAEAHRLEELLAQDDAGVRHGNIGGHGPSSINECPRIQRHRRPRRAGRSRCAIAR